MPAAVTRSTDSILSMLGPPIKPAPIVPTQLHFPITVKIVRRKANQTRREVKDKGHITNLLVFHSNNNL